MTRVTIFDEHPLMRETLRHLLESQPTVEVVGEADNGNDAVDLAMALKPDVVIMDFSLSCRDGTSAIQRIRHSGSPAEVLVCSIHDNVRIIERAMNAGAIGFVLKHETGDIINAVHALGSHRPYLSAAVRERLGREGDPVS